MTLPEGPTISARSIQTSPAPLPRNDAHALRDAGVGERAAGHGLDELGLALKTRVFL